MSLLSRSQGSKGYGACGDVPRPRADQGRQCLPRWSASIPSTVKEHGSLTVSNSRPAVRTGVCLPARRNQGACSADFGLRRFKSSLAHHQRNLFCLPGQERFLFANR